MRAWVALVMIVVGLAFVIIHLREGFLRNAGRMEPVFVETKIAAFT
jgi:hypothetical protein